VNAEAMATMKEGRPKTTPIGAVKGSSIDSAAKLVNVFGSRLFPAPGLERGGPLVGSRLTFSGFQRLAAPVF
jgi:hypothetical protein